METENILVVILSIFALLISIIAIAGVDLSKPESVDLSGIGDNEVIITAIQGDVEILQDDFDDIDCEVSEDDLEDLEDDLEKYCRNRCEDGEDGKDGFLNEYEYNCLINATNYTGFKDCLNITA